MILALLIATLFNTVSSTSTPCSGTSYSVPFPYGATAGTPDLVVAAGGVTLAYPSAWTINKVSSTSTGTVTLATACTGTVTITRTTPRTQTVNFATQGKLDTGVLTATLDRIEMQMQESVVAGGTATLSSLALTAPLPMASGGTGVSNLNCGAGVVTGNGTSLSCTTLSGLAPPGTTGVLLQSVTPGSAQTGNINVSGSVVIGGPAFSQVGANRGLRLDTTAYYQFATMLGLYAGGNGAAIDLRAYQSNEGQIQFAHCSTINTSQHSYCFLTVDGAPLTMGPALNLYGPLTSTGLITSVGLTSSGAISGTTLTSSGLATLASATVTGVSTHTGATALNGGATTTTLTASGAAALNGGTTTTTLTASGAATLNGGVTIGTGGTAISKSLRGTKAVAGGTLVAGACVQDDITITGTATGAECAMGNQFIAAAGEVRTCNTFTDLCTVRTCNANASSSITLSAQTISCRVFNP